MFPQILIAICLVILIVTAGVKLLHWVLGIDKLHATLKQIEENTRGNSGG